MFTIEQILAPGKYRFILQFLDDNNIPKQRNKWKNYDKVLSVFKSNNLLVDKRGLYDQSKSKLLKRLSPRLRDYYKHKNRAEIIYNILYPSEATIQDLPNEIIEEIVSYLPTKDIYSLAGTNKRYRMQLLGDEKNPTEREKIQRIFRAAGTRDPNLILIWAVETQNLEALRYVYENTDVKKYTYALRASALEGNLEMVRYLFEEVGLINMDNVNENLIITAKLAAQFSNVHIIKYLFEEAGLTGEDAMEALDLVPQI